MFSGNRGLARVSKMPGKTTLANIYRISDDSTWVDLPGYGYARAAKGEQARWSYLIEEYCAKRPNLKAGLWLLDVRHCGLDIDRMARHWLAGRRLPFLVILTKCDKLAAAKLRKQTDMFVEAFGLTEVPLTYSIQAPGSRDASGGASNNGAGLFNNG